MYVTYKYLYTQAYRIAQYSTDDDKEVMNNDFRSEVGDIFFNLNI